MAHKSFFNWSGGKDSSLALYHILKDKTYAVEKLLTNVNKQHGRVLMHGVREELIEQQAVSIGIPLQKTVLPDQPLMSEYEKQTTRILRQLRKKNFTHGIFGDIFLEDLRSYRETQLAAVHMEAVFPLWKKDTTELMHAFIDLGFKAIVVCVNAALLDKRFAGRIIDKEFLKDLPAHVDPCGENGEFHTFVFDGPIFNKPIVYKTGEKVFQAYKAPEPAHGGYSSQEPAATTMDFWFCDLLAR